MSVIYLKHPRHGTKVACGEGEAKADEANGWVRFDINDLRKVPPVEAPDLQVGDAVTFDATIGRPPLVIAGRLNDAGEFTAAPLPPAKRKYTRRAA